jgi:hypothetical protein
MKLPGIEPLDGEKWETLTCTVCGPICSTSNREYVSVDQINVEHCLCTGEEVDIVTGLVVS